MTLSEQLRRFADELEGTEVDVEADHPQLVFRIDEELSFSTSVPIGQIDDPYEGTVLATIFLDE